MNESAGYRIAGNGIARAIAVDGRLRTTAFVLGGTTVPLERVSELSVLLDTASWRWDIDEWRWRRSDEHGRAAGFAAVDFDDSGWQRVPHLHPIYDAAYDGHAWFRRRFALPAAADGEVVTLGIGGMDDEDWSSYRLFVNGEEVAAWVGEGRWRELHPVRIGPSDPAYALLRFGGDNVLAVEAAGLERRPVFLEPSHELRFDEEREHYFFRSWLVDQFVAVGKPFTRVDEFAVVGARERERGLEVSLRAEGAVSLTATVLYDAADGLSRKSVTLRNASDAAVRVLDVVLEDLAGAFMEPTKGGRGLPVFAGEAFFGVEDPAGVNQGDRGRLRALQLPGRTLAPGEAFVASPVVLGCARAGQDVHKAFADYVLSFRERPARRLFAYSALGWTDFTNDADPLPRLTEELLHENVALLEELRERQIEFDVYMIDDWYDEHDLMVFNRAAFPHGAAGLACRVRETGMEVGLWSATTRAIWSAHRNPELERCVAGGCNRAVVFEELADPDGKWNWDEIFARVATGEMRFCWSAEPFRSVLADALAQHVADTNAALVKLDCTALHCTSSEHDHLPGKYSVQSICDSVVGIVERIRDARPDVRMVWYWGFQSPWWLMHGDQLFDKGLKLEAASPATAPAPTWRHGVSLNVDQAIRHAPHIPLELQDSLGVWIGKVAWANRMGKADWRDALLGDLARGSGLVSLWGDVSLFDDADLAFLADAARLLRSSDATLGRTEEVGGDPWRSEPYGYLQRFPDRVLLTLSNPSFEPRRLELRAGVVGASEHTSIFECYPYPGRVDGGVRDGTLALELLPWEVRLVALVAVGNESAAEWQRRPSPRPTRRLDLSALEWRTTPGAGGSLVTVEGAVRLPTTERYDVVAIAARLHRGGSWSYVPEPNALFKLRARILGSELVFDTIPSTRSYNGPGCPWVVYRLSAGPAWSDNDLELELTASLPPDLDLVLEGWIFKAWWEESERTLDVDPVLVGRVSAALES